MKRGLDVVLSGAALAVLSPVLLAAAALIAVTIGRPVLFRQRRAGIGGRSFTMGKLRTMREPREEEDRLASDRARLTALGRWLRATSLDELPTLWNVLKGDMSLVGPRPLLPEYLPLYTPEQMRRHDVKPGITGWAQVNGRNAISWEEKFRLDLWYVDNRTFLLDLKILWLTVWQVLARKGVSAAGHATMPPFKGSRPASGDR